VAEQLGYPVSAVEAPAHLFLRYDDGRYRSNIEATSGGGELSDEQIARVLEVTPEALRSGSMMRSLSKRELLGVLIAETAVRLLREWNVGLAIQLSEMALKVHPRSIAAHWNLAVALNHRAAMRASLRVPGEKEERGGGPRVKADAKAALTHAREDTPRCACAARKDYWKRVSSLGGTEVGGVKPAPRPFDVASLLRPGGQAIHLVVEPPPGLLGDMMQDPRTCFRACGEMFGPSKPGSPRAPRP
jgi:hypothetical protein